MKIYSKHILYTLLIFTFVVVVQEFFIVAFLGNYMFEKMLLSLIFSVALYYIIINGFKKAFDFFFDNRYKISFGLFILFVSLQLHGSSINEYNNVIQPNISTPVTTNIYGESRGIRSDEWMVQTPINVSQSFSDSSYHEDNLRATSTDMFFMVRSPVKSVVTLGMISNLGFLFLPAGFGLSFWWFSRLIGLFLASIEFFLVITKKRKLSVLMGCLVTFSLPVTWWFSTYIIDQFIAGFAAIALLYYFLKTEKIKYKIIFPVLFFIAMLNYGFSMYVATLVPLSYIFLVIFIWVIVTNKRKFDKFDVIGITLGFALFVLTCLTFISSSAEAINITMNTAYPGKRTGLEKTGRFPFMFSYIYTPYFTKGAIVPNASEFSSFITFLPATYIMSIYCIWKSDTRKWLLLALFLLLNILMIYQYVGFPPTMAKYTLFSFVTRPRSRIAVEFCSLILMSLFLSSDIKSNTKEFKVFAYPSLLVSAGLIIYLFLNVGMYENFYIMEGVYLSYMNVSLMPRMYIVILNVFALTAFIFYIFYHSKVFKFSNKVVFAVVISVMLIPNIFFSNPLAKGVGVLTQKPLAKEIVKLDDNSRWLSISTAVSQNNYILSQGIKVIDSTNYYPNFELLDTLDSEKEYDEVYNRYAHVTYSFTQENTTFELMGDDSYVVYLNVEDFDKLNVDYVFSNYIVDEVYISSLNLELVYAEDGAFIYRVKKD